MAKTEEKSVEGTVATPVQTEVKASRFSTKGEEVKKVTSYLGYGVNKVTKLTVFAGISKSKDGTEYDVIDFIFADSKGATHNHRIFTFDNIEDEDKLIKAGKKATMESKYILEKALGKELELEVDTFADLQKAVKDTIKDGLVLSNHEIKISAILNQKSGKYNAGFVTYSVSEKNAQWGFGWFHNLNYDSPIKLGNKEIEEIQKANSLAAPASGGDSTLKESSGDVPF